MTLSMHQASVPVFISALRNLRHVLGKAQAHAQAQGYDPEVLLQTRLAPDMFPLLRQVQIVTDMAKNGCARLAGEEPLAFPDEESTFEELLARIDRALQYIQGFDAGRIDGSEGRQVTLSTRAAGELKFDGQSYLLQFVLPNLFFHSSIAYAILRAAGVPLGKLDFIAGGRAPV